MANLQRIKDNLRASLDVAERDLKELEQFVAQIRKKGEDTKRLDILLKIARKRIENWKDL